MDSEPVAGRYEPTPAQRFTEAVWRAPDAAMSPTGKLILLAYARHAHGGDTAWLTQKRLMSLCCFRSEWTVATARKSLIKSGWLVPVDAIRIRGGRVDVFRLTVPEPYAVSAQGGNEPYADSDPGHHQPSVDSASSRPRPDAVSAPLSGPTQCSRADNPMQSTPERPPKSAQGRSNDEHPFGGAQSGVRGGAHVPAREAAAPRAASLDNGRSERSKPQRPPWIPEAPPKDRSIAEIRKILSGRRKP